MRRSFSVRPTAIAAALALGFVAAGPALALTEEKTISKEVVLSFQDLIPEAPEGGVSWDLLGSTKANEVGEEENLRYVPDFPEAVSVLDGTTVKIRGFVFPLDQAEKQSRFLLTAYPPSCPFCLPAGPSMLVEVLAPDNPVEFGGDPVLMEGRFAVLQDDETGLFYRMTDARSVTE